MKFFKYALCVATALLFPACNVVTRAAAAQSENTAHAKLVIHVSNVRNTTGVIRCAIFASNAGWPEDKTKAIQFGSVPASVGTVTLTFTGIPQGTYAIAVFHDENENHKVDRDLFGRPKEGIGFANDPKIGFSAPSWKASSIQISAPSSETLIHLRYP